jgi:hypothetical protein
MVCDNDEHNITFVINYVATLLTKPWIKTGVLPLFRGKGGTGKTTLFVALRAIIGNKYCYQTSSLENNIFGKHAVGRKDKLLVLLDELNYNASKKYTEEMKTAITSDTMTIEPKGINSFEYDSYENYMGCSNNDVPIELTQDNRRYLIIDTDKCYYGTDDEKKEFFDDVYNIIGDRDKEPNYKILRCFYDFMVNYDIGKYNFEANVNTASTLNIAKKPIVEEFLNDYLYTLYRKDCHFKEILELSITADELYKEFGKFCERTNLQHMMTGTMFGTKIKKFNFIYAKRTKKGIDYKFNTNDYCEYFNYDNIDME